MYIDGGQRSGWSNAININDDNYTLNVWASVDNNRRGKFYAQRVIHKIMKGMTKESVNQLTQEEVLARVNQLNAEFASNPYTAGMSVIIYKDMAKRGEEKDYLSGGRESDDIQMGWKLEINNNGIISTSYIYDPKFSYFPPPNVLPGFPDAERIRGKGGRKRWRLPGGDIIEWDSQHGDLERYNPRGTEHKGSWNPDSGEQTKPPVPGRRTAKPFVWTPTYGQIPTSVPSIPSYIEGGDISTYGFLRYGAFMGAGVGLIGIGILAPGAIPAAAPALAW